MSEVQVSQPEEQAKPDYIDGILSISFNECSIVAAEASQLAHELAAGKTNVWNLRIADEFHNATTRPYEGVYLGPVPLQADLTRQTEAYLYLDVNRDGDKQLHPRILASFNRDITVPIASFEKRTGGQCTYIQLGHEMDEDNLVVTAQDVRTEIVNALRDLLNKNTEAESKDILTRFVNEQIALQSSCIETFLAPSLCDRVFDYLAGLEERKYNLLVLGQPGEEALSIDTSGGLIEKVGTPKMDDDSRPFEFVLVRQDVAKSDKKMDQKPIGLYAVARENVAIHLLDFSSSGNCTVMCEPELRPADTAELIQLREFFALQETSQDEMAELVKNLAFYKQRRDSYSVTYRIEDKIAKLATTSHLRRRELADHFGIGSRFEAAIGPYRKTEEGLIRQLGKLIRSGRFYHGGVLTDRKIGNTTGNVEVVAKTNAYWPQSYSVHLKGRPQALPDMEHVTILHETLSLTTPNTLGDDKIAELHDVLGKIATPEPKPARKKKRRKNK